MGRCPRRDGPWLAQRRADGTGVPCGGHEGVWPAPLAGLYGPIWRGWLLAAGRHLWASGVEDVGIAFRRPRRPAVTGQTAMAYQKSVREAMFKAIRVISGV